MSFLDKLKKKVVEYEQSAQDLITMDFVDEAVQQSRFEICNSCEFYFSPTGNCKKCGCFMKIKTKLKHAKCPINKW